MALRLVQRLEFNQASHDHGTSAHIVFRVQSELFCQHTCHGNIPVLCYPSIKPRSLSRRGRLVLYGLVTTHQTCP